MTDKYTDFWEGLSRFFEKEWNGIVNFAKGLLASVKDLVEGLFSLAKGLICYIGSAVVVGCADLADVEPPKWAKDTFDGGNNLVANIVRDPSIIAEGLAQGISDAWENKGAAYSVGYATGMIGSMVLADKGLSKLSRGGKAAATVDEAAGAGATGAEELAGAGVSSLDDLLRIGVNSVDDLERLGLTSVEQLSKLGISSVDDLVRLGISSADDLERLGFTSAEALEKVGITDASQLVEKGIVSEKELAEIGIKTIIKTQKEVEMPVLPEGSKWERNVLNSFAGGKSSPVTYKGGTTLYRVGGKKWRILESRSPTSN